MSNQIDNQKIELFWDNLNIEAIQLVKPPKRKNDK
jgi:hypothetical protein